MEKQRYRFTEWLDYVKKKDTPLSLENTLYYFELYNEDLYRDIKDVFNKNTGDRQFYTVPGNQVPNDQGSFSQWCYGQPPGCKEGNQIACSLQLGRSNRSHK